MSVFSEALFRQLFSIETLLRREYRSSAAEKLIRIDLLVNECRRVEQKLVAGVRKVE
jgi:hypothetical protein